MAQSDGDLLLLKRSVLKFCSREQRFSELPSTWLSEIQSQWEKYPDSVTSLFSQLGSFLRDCITNEQENTSAMECNLVSFLVDVATSLKAEQLTLSLAILLLDCFKEVESSQDSDLANKIVEALATLGSLGHASVLQEVLSALLSVYSGLCNVDADWHSRDPSCHRDLKENIPTALSKIADGVGISSLQSNVLSSLLHLISELGLACQSLDLKNGIESLGPLLPPISKSMQFLLQSPSSSPSIPQTLYRNLWFFLSLYHLCPLPSSKSPQPIPSNWVSAVGDIALATPPLISTGLSWLAEEQQLQALLQPGWIQGLREWRANGRGKEELSLSLDLSPSNESLGALSMARVNFLLAVAALECLRTLRGGGIVPHHFHLSPSPPSPSCLALNLSYLARPDLPPSEQDCLASVARKCLQIALEDVLSEGRGEKASIHSSLLIAKLASPESHLRALALEMLAKIQQRIPQVYLQPRCLKVWLEILCYCTASPLPSLPPLFQHWCSSGMAIAPATFSSLIQDTLLEEHCPSCCAASALLSALSSSPNISPILHHLDGPTASLALSSPVKEAALASSIGSLSLNFTLQTAGLPILSLGLSLKSRALGEITGLMAVLESHQVADRLVSQLRASSEVSEKSTFSHNCLLSAALIRVYFSQLHHKKLKISSQAESFILQLVDLLGSSPRLSSSGLKACLMRGALSGWGWLFAAPSVDALEASLMAAVLRAWEETMRKKEGIFSDGASFQPSAPLRPHVLPSVQLEDSFMLMSLSHKKASLVFQEFLDQVDAHGIWLGFLLDRALASTFGSSHFPSPSVHILRRLVMVSVAHPEALSAHPAAEPAFFLLLTLGLLLVIQGPPQSPELSVLEGKIIRAGLQHFSLGAHSWERPGELKGKRHFIKQRESIEMFLDMLKRLPPLPSVGPSKKVGATREQRDLLDLFCRGHLERLEVRINPTSLNTSSIFRPSLPWDWKEILITALDMGPRLPISLLSLFSYCKPLRKQLVSLMQKDLSKFCSVPEAIPFLVSAVAASEKKPPGKQIHQQIIDSLGPLLPMWAPCSVLGSLPLLSKKWQERGTAFPRYSLAVLQTYHPESVTPFLPQLVQALRYDSHGLVEEYLVGEAQRNSLFAHKLIYQLQGEEAPGEGSPDNEKVKPNELWTIVPRVRSRVIEAFSLEARRHYEHQFQFFDAVTSISGTLKPIPKSDRRAAIRPELEKIVLEGDDVYLPTEPDLLVRGIDLDSGIPLQSAAKVPIMVTFNVVNREEPDALPRPQACIFKVGDDCRQDVLALQLIAILRDVYVAAGLQLYLFPYGVLPTGYERGIIQVVPKAKSRNQIGEITDAGLYQVFLQEYGSEGSRSFEIARENFIKSCAGYAVASLLLQPKDRHNGNLLIDQEGHLVHIDFGFIFETSPGGNMRFESADFKLSHEMTQIIDPSGLMQSEHWFHFVSLCVQGYLEVRKHMEAILSLVHIMLDSGLPCFSRGDALGNLQRRFHPEMSDEEAAKFMVLTCSEAYNKWTTAGYDLVQFLQQGIEK